MREQNRHYGISILIPTSAHHDFSCRAACRSAHLGKVEFRNGSGKLHNTLGLSANRKTKVPLAPEGIQAIDAFVLARLQEEDLTPAPSAKRENSHSPALP